MKVITYMRAEGERAGILIEDTVYDIEYCSLFLDMEPIPPDLAGLLSAGKTQALRDLNLMLNEASKDKRDLPLRCWAALTEVRLRAPIRRPTKMICLGRNYRGHAQEQGAKVSESPLLFAKAPSSIIDPGQSIVIPAGSVKVDYEGELAFVIGRRTSKVSEDRAGEAIFGYCCLNDVTDREIQFNEKQWFRSKSIDTFAPLGPWIVTPDEIGDALDLRITTKVNGQVMQSDTTGNMVFTPYDIISFVTRNMTLEPGDIISTGTPAGVGVFRDPQVFLKDGDVVEITIDGIGTLKNPVAKEA